MTIVARGLGRGEQLGAIVAVGLALHSVTVLPPQFLPGGGRYVRLERPVARDQADDILLLIAAQLAIGNMH